MLVYCDTPCPSREVFILVKQTPIVLPVQGIHVESTGKLLVVLMYTDDSNLLYGLQRLVSCASQLLSSTEACFMCWPATIFYRGLFHVLASYYLLQRLVSCAGQLLSSTEACFMC
ncbi:hypothetical protein BsWGS_05127 [Bradybaena similaris]